jgi:hypothetical protein
LEKFPTRSALTCVGHATVRTLSRAVIKCLIGAPATVVFGPRNALFSRN